MFHPNPRPRFTKRAPFQSASATRRARSQIADDLLDFFDRPAGSAFRFEFEALGTYSDGNILDLRPAVGLANTSLEYGDGTLSDDLSR